MIKELSIRNFATIENLMVEFGEGLNVFTGETGSGKSIVIDALNMALGGRADTDAIRTGEQHAIIEALFYVDDSHIRKCAEDLGVDLENGKLIVKRILSGSE